MVKGVRSAIYKFSPTYGTKTFKKPCDIGGVQLQVSCDMEQRTKKACESLGQRFGATVMMHFPNEELQYLEYPDG